MNPPVSDADAKLRKAEIFFKAGKYAAALESYFDILASNNNDTQIHFYYGRCLARLGDLDGALIHLEAGEAEHTNIDLALELFGIYLAKGLSAESHALCARYIQDKYFVMNAVPRLYSGFDVRLGAELFETYFSKIISDMDFKNPWGGFLKRYNHHILTTLDNNAGAKLYFTEAFPHALAIMDENDIQSLVKASTKRPFVFHYCSWNLRSKINDAHEADSIFRQIPTWKLAILRSPGAVLILDASEEAPIVYDQDVEFLWNLMLGPAASAPRILILSANSISTSAYVQEFNIYALITDAAHPSLKLRDSDDGNYNPKHCYSFLLGVPRTQRCAFMIMMKRWGLLDISNYSWWGAQNEKSGAKLDKYVIHIQREFESLSIGNEEIDWLRQLPSRVISEGVRLNNTHYLCGTIPFEFMRSAYWHVVCETEYSNKSVLRMTEKTTKAIAVGVPFLVLGVQRFVSYIRGLGFDMLDDYINHSYDNIPDASKRLEALVEELFRLKNVRVPPDRLRCQHAHNTERLRHWREATKHAYVTQLLARLSSSGAQQSSASDNLVQSSEAKHEVLQGLGSWLFLTNDTNRTVDQITGKFLLSEPFLDSWRKVAEHRATVFADLSVKYAFLIAPNKECVYPDRLPAGLEVSSYRPVHAIIGAIAKWLPTLYPLDQLITARACHETYAEGDTHWNGWGAYIAYKSLMDALGIRAIEKEEIIFEADAVAGDLSSKIGRKTPTIFARPVAPRGVMTENNLVKNRGNYVRLENSDKTLPSAVMFRDSFGTQMLPLLAESFSRIVIVWQPNIDFNLVASEKPDIVLSQQVERFLIQCPNDAEGKTHLDYVAEKTLHR